MKNYTEFCNEQAKIIFDIINNHENLLKWQKTWSVKNSISLPQNVDKRFYSGLNIWHLLNAQISKGYTSNLWLTYNQINSLGGQVLKGATGEKIYFFRKVERDLSDQNDDDEKRQAAIYKTYCVFNLNQTTLLKENLNSIDGSEISSIQSFVKALKVNFSFYGNQPLYNAKDDVIIMPEKKCFRTKCDFLTTFFHELIHWSGTHNRMNRECLTNYSTSVLARAEEELIAEIGSVFLASHFSITGDLTSHASYTKSWMQNLDPKTVSKSIRQASQAFIWLLNKAEEEISNMKLSANSFINSN